MSNLRGLDLMSLLQQVKEVTIHASRHVSASASALEGHATTQIDKLIDNELSDRLPQVLRVGILSEETGLSHSSELVWVIDPLDGTYNAIAHTPDIAVSVALASMDGMQPILGVVVVPHQDLVFSAAKGCGAFCNGQALPLFTPDPRFRLLSLGLSNDASQHALFIGSSLTRIIHDGWILRQSGSAALDICRTAAGNWHAFHEFGAKLWDVAAADIIAKEAGCETHMAPSRLTMDSSAYCVDYLACNKLPSCMELRTLLSQL